MPLVPSPPPLPSKPASHDDPTPALLQSVGGRTFALAVLVVIAAVALSAADIDLKPWAVEMIELALMTVGGSTAVKKAAGAWASTRRQQPSMSDHVTDDDPIVMDVPAEGDR